MPKVLITGASRGIGRATSLRLAAAGWDVLAGVRREQDGAALAAESPKITPVVLDITSADDIERVAAEVTHLDALVNNAGFALLGPIEGVPLEALREQLEVNFFGHIAVTQALLPRLRESRGRIVFTSSLSGRIATPLTGPYNASKFALEGAVDALRMELKPWGIRVALVEPAQIATDIWGNAEADFDAAIAAMPQAAQELYADHTEGFRKSIPLSQKLAAPVDTVSKAIEKALTSRHPRARYVVGAFPKAQAVLTGASPTPAVDAILRKMTGVPGKL
jgi:NAD(P)-dependent dehydrogenase (short-subunit alcohol dehydrogenase family)